MSITRNMGCRHLYILFLWFCLLPGSGATSLVAQEGQNPFELTPRLPKPTTQEGVPANPFELARPVGQTAVVTTPGNPFEIDPAATPTSDTGTSNPFDITAPPPVSTPLSNPIPDRVIESLLEQRNFLLLLVLLNVLLITFAISLFRDIYGKAYQAIFNDNMLSQLYRERYSGNSGNYYLAYAIFFVFGGAYTYLCARYFGYLPATSPWWHWLLCISLVIGVFLCHHLLLAVVGYIFPAEKETSLYSFTIMLFGIFASLPLVIAVVGIAYLPVTATAFMVYGSLALFAILYLIRSFRGAFIGNRFAINYSLHFLLYLCTIEIMPVLLLYKLVSSNL